MMTRRIPDLSIWTVAASASPNPATTIPAAMIPIEQTIEHDGRSNPKMLENMQVNTFWDAMNIAAVDKGTRSIPYKIVAYPIVVAAA